MTGQGELHLSVIVLTKDEAANLPALLDSLAGLACRVFVVDSGSADATVAIAEAAGCTVVSHPFANYAAQRNWAFEQLPITTPWVLSLDADERLTPELRDEMAMVVAADDPAFAGWMLKKQTWFMGRWLKHGGQYPAWHLRLARTGKVRCEERLYDQHFVVDGPVGRLRHDYIDILTDSLTSWTDRHNRWATLEAAELLAAQSNMQVQPRWGGTPIERKRFLRTKVYKSFPLFLLFLFDYIIRGGFLDGKPGLIFHVLQRFWFRVPDRGSVNPTVLAGMGSETHSCLRGGHRWGRRRHRQGCVSIASIVAGLFELQVRRRADRSGFEP